MIPYTYQMVDMGGIDLAEANHTVVEGIFSRFEEALDDTRVLVLYNMYFAKIRIPPAYCNIDVEGGSIYINDSIEVSADDEVTVIAIPPPLEPVIPLSVDDNGVYSIEPPQSGYNPVTVALQFTELLATENGEYVPESPSRGFSKATVNVPTMQVGSYDPIYDSSIVSSIDGKITVVGPYAAFQGRVTFNSTLNLQNRKIFTIPSSIVPSGYFEFSGLGTGGNSTKANGHINIEDGGFYIDTSISVSYIYVEAQWFFGTPVPVTPIASGISITGSIAVSENIADMHLKVVLSGSNSWTDLFSIPQPMTQDSEVPFIVALTGNTPVKDARVSSGVVGAWLPSGSNTLLVHKTWKFN